jgi:hypothetical protein
MMAAEQRRRHPVRGSGSINYLRVVALHISGLSNKEIAENLGCSTGMVGDALQSPEGLALITDAKRRIKENVFGRLEAELIDLADLSVNNLRRTVEATFAPGSRGKIHQDNVGLKLLGMFGYSEDALGDQRRKSDTQIDDALGRKLLSALEKANKNLDGEDLKLGKDAYIEDAVIVPPEAEEVPERKKAVNE